MKASRSEFVDLGGVRLHVRRWGDPNAPILVMLHGWMDMSATFQFVVDALGREWNIIAPDWPGFGLSDWNACDYSLLQYAADLDRLLDHYSPERPVPIVAHSMGANVCSIYAGARPQRISHYINIEGYAPVPGFFEGSLGQTVGRWLDYQRKPGQARAYGSHAELAERLRESNRRLSPERAEFLASQLGQVQDDGLIRIAADPRTRFFAPISLHPVQLMELWADIASPVLCIRGGRSFVSHAFIDHSDDLAARIASLPQGREVLIEDGSHNLHHEFPQQVAALIEDFLAA
jgi:pimeloyl-ACP methyl ester carboxylesterase